MEIKRPNTSTSFKVGGLSDTKTILIIIVMFIAFFLVGCKTKRIEHTIYKTDTIKTKEIIKIDKPQLNEIFIDNICDSLGNLKHIYYTNTSGAVKTTLKSDKNTLKLEVNVDSIVNSKLEQYKSSIVKEKEVLVKYKNKRLMWYSIILNVLLLGWIFRKPLLRLLKPI